MPFAEKDEFERVPFFKDLVKRRVPQTFGLYLLSCWGAVEFVDWNVEISQFQLLQGFVLRDSSPDVIDSYRPEGTFRIAQINRHEGLIDFQDFPKHLCSMFSHLVIK